MQRILQRLEQDATFAATMASALSLEEARRAHIIETAVREHGEHGPDSNQFRTVLEERGYNRNTITRAIAIYAAMSAPASWTSGPYVPSVVKVALTDVLRWWKP